MIWQDLVIAIANGIFTFSLFSQAWHGYKKKKGYILLKTSGLTSLGLYAIAISFLTLNLYFSAIIATINATLWLILFIQRKIYVQA